MKSDVKGNAHRLAYALKGMSENKRFVEIMSNLLNYDKTQLAEDVEAISVYIDKLEKQIKDAE